MYAAQHRCIPDEIDLFYFKTCIITHSNNIIEQNINVSMFDILLDFSLFLFSTGMLINIQLRCVLH